MKGIILAGGMGTRLWPITKGISKQLLPVYDKPMIYYSLSTLMLAGLRDLAVITTKEDSASFQMLLGNGSQWGINLEYLIQREPRGIAESFLIAEEFLAKDSAALILGDNIFNGSGVGRNLATFRDIDGAHVFAQRVTNPNQFGIIDLDENGSPKSIKEKPSNSKSKLAVPGLYFYSNDVVEMCKNLLPSSRGELEITSLNDLYLKEGRLKVTILPRGTVWLDGGTVESLHDASVYVRVVEHRQGLKIGCVEEIAWRNGWINDQQLKHLSVPLKSSGYGNYLEGLLEGPK